MIARPVDAAIDAPPAVDAMQFALFDHLAVREVKMFPRVKVAMPEAVSKRVPRITGKPTTETHPLVAFPPWMQQQIGRSQLVAAHVEADGSAAVVSAFGIAALIDREHRVEGGFDFAPTTWRVSDIHRVGGIEIVAAEDPQDSMESEFPRAFLVAIDAATATVAWVGERGGTTQHFAVWGGYILTSVDHRIYVYAPNTGALVSSVPVKGGPFLLIEDATGIHGIPDLNTPTPSETGIDLAVE